MANLSTAFGTTTITAPTKDLLAKFLYLQTKSNEHAYYDTTFDRTHNSTFDKIKELVKESAIEYSTSATIDLSFTGTGRWVFYNNIAWFFDDLKPDAKLEWLFEKDEQLRNIVAQLQKEKLHATFDVSDSEPGANFITLFEQEIEWNPDQQKSIISDENVSVSTEFTAENLIKYDFYDTDEVIDVEYIRDHFDDFITELKSYKSGTANDQTICRNILNNLDGFKKFINSPKFDCHGVYYDIDEILFDVLKLTPDTKFS